MIDATFECGCHDQVSAGPSFARCPLHDARRVRMIVGHPLAMAMAFGPTAPLPDGGLFYPKIEGMKGVFA